MYIYIYVYTHTYFYVYIHKYIYTDSIYCQTLDTGHARTKIRVASITALAELCAKGTRASLFFVGLLEDACR
jgi:hypothetical protein